MISRKVLRFDLAGYDVDVRLYRPRRDSWSVGLSLTREWHRTEDQWSLLIGWVQIVVEIINP